jgi:hypothetical protein
MPGAGCARGLACEKRKHTSKVTTVTPVHPAFPARMVLTVSFVLFPGTGLYCPRRSWSSPHDLSASVGAPEPHDFAVRGANVIRRLT